MSHNIKSINLERRVQNVLNWLTRLKIGSSQYRLSEQSPPTLMSTSFGILLLELLNQIDFMSDNEKKSWIDYLNNHQNISTGLYTDPELETKDLISNKHDLEYLNLQTHFFCLSALDALDGKPLYPFIFLEQYKNSSNLTSWWNKLNWEDPWLESNKVMFVLNSLTFQYETYTDMESYRTIKIILDWLETSWDPRTGFWGTDKGASLYYGMAGAYHLYPFFLYFNRPISNIARIINSILAIQSSDGLFNPAGGGGSYEDLDAIDLLVKMSLMTGYRKNHIRSAMKRSYSALLKNQNPDGGFCWTKRTKFTIPQWYISLNPFYCSRILLFHLKDYYWWYRSIFAGQLKPQTKNTVYYSGWKKMSFEHSESDLWSCWFRLSAIATIQSRWLDIVQDKPYPFRFRRLPGLGWHSITLKKPTILERTYPDKIGTPLTMQNNLYGRYSYFINTIRNEINKNQKIRILDAGTGTGWGTKNIAETGHWTVGIDLNFDTLKEIKNNHPTLMLIVADLRHLPFKTGSFDVIACLEVIEHLTKQDAGLFLKESNRILKKETGTIIGSTPLAFGKYGNDKPLNPYHYHEYSISELYVYLKCYFGQEFDIIFPKEKYLLYTSYILFHIRHHGSRRNANFTHPVSDWLRWMVKNSCSTTMLLICLQYRFYDPTIYWRLIKLNIKKLLSGRCLTGKLYH